MASSSETTPPSSSSSSTPRWKYDVFLSFRGPDTRRSITSDIYDGLQKKRGIRTFMDNPDLRVGEAISSRLLMAIKESRFAVVVLSPDYASSTWCLEELAEICQCMGDNDRILPLFYKVDPKDVRHQKRTFEDSFTHHANSGRYKSEKLKLWRDALKKVATISGWHTDNFKTDRELVDYIVESVCTKVLSTAFQSTKEITIFEATRQAVDQVMKALKDNKVTAVGVQGMGGVGKTTLAMHVGQQGRKQGLFDHVIVATVNQPLDERKIQGMLADELGITFMNEIVEGRAFRLSSEIMSRDKILIILDNVWEMKMIDLKRIGIPSYNMLESRNSKVLLTTRIKNVCHVLRSEKNMITLNSLSEEDSWILFGEHARKSFESIDFENVARKVAKECGGLPIALMAVASALGDKDMDDWELAAEQLEKSKAAHLDHKPDASDCIRLSYNFLGDQNSKECFLLCCLFPEDYDIRIEDLFKYSVGKGLFKDAETIQEARRKAGSVAKHLKDSSLLLDSKLDGCVRMHDVVRDTAIQITQSRDKHRYLVKADVGLKNRPGGLGGGYTAISLMRNDIRELPEELVCPELEILLLQENADLDQVPDTFFKSTSFLRVLDLSYTSISSLSKSFISLSNLQGLYLDSCPKISDISVLKNFEKLEILSMKEYPLKELSKEIGNLTNLRVLDVSGNDLVGEGIGRIPSEVISKLTKLQELCLHCGFWDWGSKVEGEEEKTNAQFDEVTRLSNLKTLKVCISDPNCIPEKLEDSPSWTRFDIYIGRHMNTRNIIRDLHNPLWVDDHKYSRSLVLDTAINMLPDWFVSVVTQSTEKLMYVNFRGLRNLLVEYQNGRLRSLKHLSVIGPNMSLKTLILITSLPNKPVFESLEELHLESMGSLKELCSGELPSGSLLNLKLLKVHDCPKLGNVLLPSKLLRRLENLEILLCKAVPMEYVFGCEGFALAQSKLIHIKLVELDAVKSICDGLAPPKMFKALKSLFIYQCKFQGCLFTSQVAQCLESDLQVENIFIESCPNLERVFKPSEEESKESEQANKIVLPELKSLVLVDLPMLYSGGADNDMMCPSLQYLYVEKCPHFTTSASNLGSKYQIKFNDISHYLVLRTSSWTVRSGKTNHHPARHIPYSLAKVLDKTFTSLGDENNRKMRELMTRPDYRESYVKFMQSIQESMPKIPEGLWKASAPIANHTPEIAKLMLEIMEKKPPYLDELEKDTPEEMIFKLRSPEKRDQLTEVLQFYARALEVRDEIKNLIETGETRD